MYLFEFRYVFVHEYFDIMHSKLNMLFCYDHLFVILYLYVAKGMDYADLPNKVCVYQSNSIRS
jgi:hypothetical protein